MISREELRRLAEVEAHDETAISFFFQPRTPRNKAHREEQILLKDLVHSALDRALHDPSVPGGRTRSGLKSDLERLQLLGDSLRANGTHTKVVFACHQLDLWKEFDLPIEVANTGLHVNRHFHLKPLAMALATTPRTCVAIVDRKRARIYEVRMQKARYVCDVNDEIPLHGRSDGYHGYDAGHKERHFENSAMRHFKNVADRLKALFDAEHFDHLALGCREEICSEFLPQLHTYLQKRMLGHFPADPGDITPETILQQTEKMLRRFQKEERESLVRDVIGEAHRDGNGAVGLRSVLRAVEKGEVHKLLIGRAFNAQASECGHCGHMDTRVSKACGVCGKEGVRVKEITDSIVRRAVLTNIEMVFVDDDAEFDRVGNIGALLRFRAEQNTPAKMAG
jgi:peptide subunit release factor 1 (eRF1)